MQSAIYVMQHTLPYKLHNEKRGKIESRLMFCYWKSSISWYTFYTTCTHVELVLKGAVTRGSSGDDGILLLLTFSQWLAAEPLIFEAVAMSYRTGPSASTPILFPISLTSHLITQSVCISCKLCCLWVCVLKKELLESANCWRRILHFLWRFERWRASRFGPDIVIYGRQWTCYGSICH